VFSAFLLGGGTTATILGSIGGLNVVANIFEISVHGQIFGIGRGAEPPQMGYCIGNKFKQHVYTRMDVQNDGLGRTITTNVSVELLQNSRFKRVFVKYGTVVKYTVNNVDNINEYVLTLDVTKNTPPPSVSLSGNTIKIIKQSSKGSPIIPSISVNVLSIKSNWDVVISKPSGDVSPGDYYELNTIWCIEDPYLLSGFWMGAEDSLSPPLPPSSGMDLYVTSHNSPYEEGKFLGFYIWQVDISLTTTTTSTTTSATATSTATTTTPAPPLGIAQQPSPGFSMNDQAGYTWAFGGFGNSPQYPVYPNDTRYRIVKLDAPDESGAMIQYNTRIKATNLDYDNLLKTSPSYIRIEIGTGGYIDRHNWYSPCLKGSYIKNNGNLYLIIDHVAFNIIDVSRISIDGLSTFDPLVNQNYSIVNQYAWFINEHYDGRIGGGNNTGIFRGTVRDISSDKLEFTIQTLGDTFISLYKSHGLSFIDRYRNNATLPTGFVKLFEKFDGWKLVNNNKEYAIESIDFGKVISPQYTPYPIVVKLQNSTSGIVLNSNAYIAFDSTYDVVGNYSKESGFSFVLDVNAAYITPPGGQSNAFIVSNQLCLDGEYVSNPYQIDIGPEDMIGFTDGYLFGVEANGSAQSRYSQSMFFTTPRSGIGLSSLFHALREEDWIAYKDPPTGNITIRKGSLDFREYPSKDEVVMGLPSLIENPSVSGGNQISLNSSQDRLRRLSLQVENFSPGTSPSLTFGIGSYDNIYGFLVSGQGKVDLQDLRVQGIVSGAVSSNTYSDTEGNIISPVYVYKRSSFQASDKIYVDIGASTKDPIYVRGGSVSSIIAQYIHKGQVLNDANLIDVIKLRDGEIIMFYGKSLYPFNLYNEDLTDNKINNFSGNKTRWFNPNAVLSLGSFNDAYFWGTPFKIKYGDTNSRFLYPLMLLNSVEYVGCLYDSLSEYINIFVRAFRGSTSYLASLRISVQTFTHTTYECRGLNYSDTDASTKTSTFFYRPPLLPDDFISNVNKSWIHDSSDIIQNYFNLSTSIDPLINDQYVNILGSGCQVVYGGEFGIITAFVQVDGTYTICYDTEVGIKTLYSSNQGLSWIGSNLVLARNGRCGFVLGGLLFYISESGIIMKDLSPTDFSDIKSLAMQREAGNANISDEINKQSYLDTSKTVLLGSGSIGYQRLSGYITPQGTIKIFFYNNNGKLKGMESSDRSTWIVSDNF
jgi:hypothetical protein